MSKNDISLDKDFEMFLNETYPNENYDLTLIDDKKGSYKDPTVAVLYSAFRRCYRDSRKFFLYQPVKSKVNIIARSENGKLKFSDNTFVHRTLEGAQQEANRLSEKLKTKVHVFTKVSSHEFKSK